MGKTNTKYSVHGQKCKACGKMGHFAKVCLFSMRQLGISIMVGSVQVQGKEDETYVDKIGQTQPYPKVKNDQTHKYIEKVGKWRHVYQRILGLMCP